MPLGCQSTSNSSSGTSSTACGYTTSGGTTCGATYTAIPSTNAGVGGRSSVGIGCVNNGGARSSGGSNKGTK